MNYIRYDKNTGEILQMGWGTDEAVQNEIDLGSPTIAYEGVIEWGKFRVNLKTNQIEQITPT